MLHIGKNTRGYILNGYMSNSQSDIFVPGTCVKAYLDANMGIEISKKDIQNFSFAHGNIEQLLNGKMCVVRELLLYPITSGKAWWLDNKPTYYYADLIKGCIEKYVIHLIDGGVLIIIGITPNRNVKVIYKP